MTLESFILAFILWMEPLMKNVASEDPSIRLERYKAIAADIAEVCSDPTEAPVFNGPNARIKTCMLIASIAHNESGFKHSIDSGIERGDGGRSVGIMQVQHGQKGKLAFTLDQLKDRKTNIKAGLAVLRNSKCNSGTDMNNMLRGYVNGSCTPLEDPKRDAIVLKTSIADAAGFVNYFKQYKVIPKINMESKPQIEQNNKDPINKDILVNIVEK